MTGTRMVKVAIQPPLIKEDRERLEGWFKSFAEGAVVRMHQVPRVGDEIVLDASAWEVMRVIWRVNDPKAMPIVAVERDRP